MKIMSDGKEIGSIYCNIQLDKSSFKTGYITVLDKLKDGGLSIEIDRGKYLTSYRRVHQDDNNIYLEGAELVSK